MVAAVKSTSTGIKITLCSTF